MPRRPSLRLLGPALALITLALLFPALASALPNHREAVFSAAERPEARPSLFSQLRDLLSVLWGETGSGLDPDGAGTGTSSGSGTAPNAAGTGDNGSGLEPNG